ncbi:Cytochrome c1 heme lyase [Yamadazyma tenuis]|uniref:Holocytochrome c-type synthase n=1 Tax=Candida tenuis (strain ATCC 10573 / BCRC 21748 / CBS 615 / JCM 9827 / NBRC 10315 / NRRL Y-1498 / VKM Y-70) TaxID=590646 RepID=G3B6B5_CANTC|nr:cytochrome c and c1 heme-lyase [Yamadazyma tenuis ATCC 10573]XP_006687460.1 uncharacterized protein CANTEDRAFT_114733 [Yamadazyma tenuis ATCC 10573]EGV63666.1 cytochrome c and c1 heme-lyase [Yamadazyma tenuis ATCC 10573]EGV63667.1 hypothetical protein CANTEDRAFT_114733 [Yamadazyma tenuis ATCC 10573]WEJ96748.1 Cytochrome c1 heme lyase [Yamadazyma tenuis]
MSEDQPKCPVDHTTRSSWSSWLWAQKPNPPDTCPVSLPPVTTDEQPKCPVDHNARSDWLKKVSVSATVSTEAVEEPMSSATSSGLKSPTATHDVALPTDRMISSIPRTSSQSNWVYPSEKQFYEAMMRKNWNPKAEDMKTVVPIHNLVNERTWNHIMNWEQPFYEQSLQKCGGIKLTSFKGNPQKLTPRAWFRSNVLGLPAPFDRHDWVVDRCGTEVEYVIDFYSATDDNPNVFLDVRPKLNTWEGVKLRVGRAVSGS